EHQLQVPGLVVRRNDDGEPHEGLQVRAVPAGRRRSPGARSSSPPRTGVGSYPCSRGRALHARRTGAPCVESRMAGRARRNTPAAPREPASSARSMSSFLTSGIGPSASTESSRRIVRTSTVPEPPGRPCRWRRRPRAAPFRSRARPRRPRPARSRGRAARPASATAGCDGIEASCPVVAAPRRATRVGSLALDVAGIILTRPGRGAPPRAPAGPMLDPRSEPRARGMEEDRWPPGAGPARGRRMGIAVIGRSRRWDGERWTHRALLRAGHVATLVDDRRAFRALDRRGAGAWVRARIEAFGPARSILARAIGGPADVPREPCAAVPSLMWPRDLRIPPDPATLERAACVDTTFLTAGGHAPLLEAVGARRASCLPDGVEPMVDRPAAPHPEYACDIAFIGATGEEDRVA